MIDTANKYLVASQGEGIRIMYPPRDTMTEDEALTLAAWLVALADTNERFPEFLKAVQNT